MKTSKLLFFLLLLAAALLFAACAGGGDGDALTSSAETTATVAVTTVTAADTTTAAQSIVTTMVTTLVTTAPVTVAYTLHDGVLALTYTGAMPDYPSASDAPWYADRADVTLLLLPDAATSVGKNAFSGFENLAGVLLPHTIKTIEESAFSGCTALTGIYYTGTASAFNRITAAEGNDAIKSAALCLYSQWRYGPQDPVTWQYDADNLPTTEYPRTLIAGASATDTITWELYNDGELLLTGSGATLNYSEDIDAPWLLYVRNIRRVVIGEGITVLGDLSFVGCKEMTELVLPTTLTEIRHLAFRDASSLTVFDAGATALSVIGSSTLIGCSSLETLSLPAALTRVEEGAFDGCASLQTVRYGGSAADWAEVLIAATGNAPLTAATLIPVY